MMGQTGTPVDTKRTVVQFSCLAWKHCDGSRLPHLTRSMAGVGGCTAHVAVLLMGWVACWVVSCGGCEILW